MTSFKTNNFRLALNQQSIFIYYIKLKSTQVLHCHTYQQNLFHENGRLSENYVTPLIAFSIKDRKRTTSKKHMGSSISL